MNGFLIVLVIGLPWLGALGVGLVGDRHARAQHILAAVSSVGAGLAALALLPLATNEAVIRLPAGKVFGEWTFVPDGLAVAIAAIATVVGSLAVLFSIDYMRGKAQLGRYYALVLLFIGAMAGLVLAGSLLLLFFFWELVAFCSYALISFHNDNPQAVAGGIKALLITQIGGLGLLLGALTTRAYLGDDQVTVLLARAHELPPGVVAVVAFGFLVAAAAKSAQAPFHTWLPDAMEAPTPVSALIHAATMVNAGVYLLARFYPAFAHVPGWSTAVMTVGMVSALMAGLMALAATDLKRALAYSTISQIGSMFSAAGAGVIFASQFHLLSHAVFKALLFLSAGAIIKAVGTRDMRRMGGLGRSMPAVRNLFLIGALALIGVPIFNGFWSKELLLEASLARGPWWISAGLLAGASLTALYTIRMISMVFYGPTAAQAAAPWPRWSPSGAALGLLALGTLTSWLLAGPFSRLLATSLPFHVIELKTTIALCVETLAAPATALGLAASGVGLAAWGLRDHLAALAHWPRWLIRAVRGEFGFDWLNRRLIAATHSATRTLAATQTGQLNWNIAAIAGGLAIVLAILALGA